MLYKCILISFCQGSNSRRRSISHLNFIDIRFIYRSDRNIPIIRCSNSRCCWFHQECYISFNRSWHIKLHTIFCIKTCSISWGFHNCSVASYSTRRIKCCAILHFCIIFFPFEFCISWIKPLLTCRACII